MIGTAAVTIIGPLSGIPRGEGRTFEVNGEMIAVFHTRQGEVRAVQAACPHRGGPLADGLVGGDTVVCPLHARKYDLATGAVISGECPIKSYPVRVDENLNVVMVRS
jgi:nitrite reductase (NADH) small subunit